MARYAIGDLQGCYTELRKLLAQLKFKSDRDQVWFTGDLVNRGPESLEALRFVRDLGDNAITVLGNHDLHLLAQWRKPGRGPKKKDTLDAVLTAPDRESLLQWLASRPLLHLQGRDLLVHAGLVPQWSAKQARGYAREVERAIADDIDAALAEMYGDRPDRFDESLHGADRWRCIVNICTRMRLCSADGRIDTKSKGGPVDASGEFAPWYKHDAEWKKDTRVIFGHWSTLGFYDDDSVLCLDTGCVWGGTLTAVNLDEDEARPVSQTCLGYQEIN
ncbi:MAG: symmetrical bis(5'-nucleosyl)-tetraphosphatase [Steroidobacteraceae bacterium]